MAESDTHVVRVEAPTANKVIAFAIAGVALFIALVFVTNVRAFLFQLAMVGAAGVAAAYAYRTARTELLADRNGVTVRNLRATRTIAWRDIDHIGVAKLDHNQGTGMEIATLDGDRIAVEASWGPWYRTAKAEANTHRCEAIIAELDRLRTEAGHGSQDDDDAPPDIRIHWLTAFIDLPAEAWSDGVTFWTRATRSTLSDLRGETNEFATLIPADGGPYLKMQRLDDGGPSVHLDIHVDEVADAVARAEALGAAVVAAPDHVVMTSPAGFTFCFVDEQVAGGVPPPEDSATPNRLDQVTIDIPAALFDRECTFWAALTGWRIREGSRVEFRYLDRPDGIPLRLMFQRLGREDHAPGATAHLDFSCGEDLMDLLMRHDRYDAKRVVNKGAWVVMQSPSGLPYCLTTRDPHTGLAP